MGLQIEYSLLERSVEQELIPLALEFGLGVTPWSPLKSGALSGKYTRANAGVVKGDRGLFLEGSLNEKTYALIDQLEIIAKAHDTSVAAVSLAWVLAKPGVTSPIIGARRLAQLEDNIKALDIKLTRRRDRHARRPDPAQAWLPAKHAADGAGDPQWRRERQRRLRPAIRLRDAAGR